MRILSPPRRTSIAGATFSRNSEAYDSLGRIALPGLPRLEYVPGVGWVTWVEEAAENLIPVDKQKFEGWIAYGGATVTLTQNQAVSEWGAKDATRIQTSGGTSTTKYYSYFVTPSISAQKYVVSVYIKNISSVSMVISNNFVNITVAAGEIKKIETIVTGNGTVNIGLFFITANITDALDLYVWHPMIDTKSYPTSFCIGTRAAESLTMPVLATNLLTVNQASAETNLAGFAASGAMTLSRDTTQHKYGSASLKIVTPGSITQEGFYTTATTVAASNTYTFSVWVKGSGTIKCSIYERTSAGTLVGITSSNVITLTDTWTRYSVTRAFGDTGVLAYGVIMTSVIQATTFYVDGLQLELGPYATTWNIPTGELVPRMGLPVEHGTIEGIVEINDNSKRQVNGQYNGIFHLCGSPGNGIILRHRDSSAAWNIVSWDSLNLNVSSVNINDSLTPNGWYYYKVYWDSGQVKVEFWSIASKVKTAEVSIPKTYFPMAFASVINLGNSFGVWFLNTRFGKHRLSNITRTDDPDFDNLMPNDANTVGIFDPTPNYNHVR